MSKKSSNFAVEIKNQLVMKTKLQTMTDEQLTGMCNALKLVLCYDTECDVLSYSFVKLVDAQIKRLENEVTKRGLDI